MLKVGLGLAAGWAGLAGLAGAGVGCAQRRKGRRTREVD